MKTQTVCGPLRLWVLGLMTLALAACSDSDVLSGSPTIYSGQTPYPADAVALSQRTAAANLLFVTDRQPNGAGSYSSDRSPQISFGSAIVSVGDGATTWDDVVRHSNGGTERLPLMLTGVTEVGRLPATPLPFTVQNGRPVDDAPSAAAYRAGQAQMQQMLEARLRQDGTGDVILLIPGVATSFEDGMVALTDLWHNSGREAVPILYSWPSGSGGLFGYFTDRESGEFTVFHLKELFRLLARTRGVERVHVISQSRGTDVVTTALRELIIESRARGNNPRDEFRIANLVMAAADLDFSVVGQRLVAERFGPAIGRITVYTSDHDNALATAQRLMTGTRFGRLEPGEVPMNQQEIFGNLRNVAFVNVIDAGGRFGHDYYRRNPRVLTDIVQLIRTCAAPGTPDRPLARLPDNFWQITDTYFEGATATGRRCR